MSDNRAMQYAEILSKLVKFETVSSRENKDRTKFLKFHELLRETFPNFFNTVECEEFDGSLLLKWKGTDSSLKPVMLMNHHDVVEASGEWTHPAFSGAIADGRVWGRGTVDTKASLCCMLQAVEELIKEGFDDGIVSHGSKDCSSFLIGTQQQTQNCNRSVPRPTNSSAAKNVYKLKQQHTKHRCDKGCHRYHPT